MNNYSRRSVGVVGSRGYSGAELLQILKHHPYTDIVLLEHRADAEARSGPLGQTPYQTIPADAESARREGIQLVFLATPPSASMELAPALLSAGIKVVDLSGAFRLGDAATYTRWYKEDHSASELFANAVYGLPEFYRDRIRDAQLVANPGCYPTAANLAIRPLMTAQVVDRSRGIVCDAKSGVSGAGRHPTNKNAFCEVTENFSVYGFSSHRHVPEILQTTGLGERELTFTAQLLPLDRGILETIYLRTSRVEKAVDLLAIYEDAYENEPFVRFYAPGKVPDLRSVQRTNFCDIGFVFDSNTQRVTVVTAIDNLGKGAAGQAVQNMNLMLGFAETEALL